MLWRFGSKWSEMAMRCFEVVWGTLIEDRGRGVNPHFTNRQIVRP
jgi:hypothetical protein